MKSAIASLMILAFFIGTPAGASASDLLDKNYARIVNKHGNCMCVRAFSPVGGHGRKACTSVVGGKATSATFGANTIYRIRFYIYASKTCDERSNAHVLVGNLRHPKNVGTGGKFTFEPYIGRLGDDNVLVENETTPGDTFIQR